MRRILSIDGGGIKGVFPAAFLATLEEATGLRIADYFDLIVGTSTGGIIAIGLGLGFSGSDLLRFYEHYGPQIFPKRHFAFLRRWFGEKYNVAPLRTALEEQFGGRLLGESKSRLVIPALNLDNGDVHIYKTAHHPHFEIDYKIPAVDVALSTSAAPTYFREHIGHSGPALVDGGLWANNPTGLAVVEAIGVLEWAREEIDLLSIGCTTSPLQSMNAGHGGKGEAYYAMRIVDLFMCAQSFGSIGTAAVLIGHNHIQRYSVAVDRKRFDLADADGIPELRRLGEAEARKALPAIRATFLGQPAEPFSPYRRVDGQL